MKRFYVRASDYLAGQIEKAASERGFDSVAAFIRQTISNELRTGDSAIRETEDSITATLDLLAKEVHSLQTAQQALYALVDSFVRLFLMCVPEPSGDAVDPVKARAAARYHNFLRNVAHNMSGNVQEDLKLLLGYVPAR